MAKTKSTPDVTDPAVEAAPETPVDGVSFTETESVVETFEDEPLEAVTDNPPAINPDETTAPTADWDSIVLPNIGGSLDSQVVTIGGVDYDRTFTPDAEILAARIAAGDIGDGDHQAL
jgi:hypothetical protein